MQVCRPDHVVIVFAGGEHMPANHDATPDAKVKING